MDSERRPIVPGVRLGVYVVEAPLGAGGMGSVYRAVDTRLNRPVAIKVLSDDLADFTSRRRFQREAQMASALNHPHILTVHDVGEFDGRQYLVTEFVDGGTLRSWMPQRHDWRQTIELLIGIADGLAAAHEAGILHRDVKPENILITKSGYAKLADFGLAKLHEAPTAIDTTELVTRPGIVAGTVPYMSPEQALGRPLDHRSDIFSLGVVLYEALAGRRPFTDASDLGVLHAIAHQPAPALPEQVPAALRMVVEKSLAKDPVQRFQSTREMVVDLRRVVRHSADLSPVPPPAGPRKATRDLPLSLILLIAVAALGLVAAMIAFRGREPAASESKPAYVQLTSFDAATSPTISADGRLLAFVHGPETNVAFTGAPSEIFVKVLPSGDPVQLTNDGVPNKFAPRFSPDGTRIAYSTLDPAGWTTWVVPVIGGQKPRRLLPGVEGLSWITERKKDGTLEPRILFSYLTGKGITLAVASATESRSDERLVFVEDGIMDHFSYLSPDRENLLLAEMGFDGWQSCRVAPFDGSSKGRKVGPPRAQCTGAAWSPDGQWMYFSADTGSGFHIWRQRFPNGSAEQITFGPSEEEGIDFFPDGKSFVTSIGTRQSTLWIHDAKGDRQITSEAYTFNPSFSADGKTLFYLVRTGVGSSSVPRGALWAADLESGQRRRVLPDFQMEHYAVSSDGSRVVFVSGFDDARRGVWLASPDGSSAPRQLSSSRAGYAYFGAGGDVFFSAADSSGTFVYRVREDGSGLEKAIASPVYLLFGVAPDGKHLAVWDDGPTRDTANSVRLHSIDGGAPIVLCSGDCAFRTDGSWPQEVSWSPDGKFVYLAFMGGSAVFAVPLSRGELLPPLPPLGVRSLEEAAAMRGVKPFAIPGAFPGPDPSVYAYQKLSAQRNIFQVAVP